MSINRINFDEVVEQDLVELVEGQVPEGLTLEYKLAAYGTSDADKRELLKDVSAIANSSGGHLIIGIREDAGVAAEISGVELNADQEILRIEQMLRSGIEPPIPGVRSKNIPLDTGGSAILLRIPKSWNPPHRVVSNRVNRFYMRNSAGVFEPSVPELRAVFSQMSSSLEQAKSFREDRINTITTDRGPRPLQGEGRLFFHIVPVASLQGHVNLNVQDIYEHHQSFWPLGATGMTPRYNFHGVINERGGDTNNGYTQIFRNGVVEATFSHLTREHQGGLVIPGVAIERYFFESYTRYIAGLSQLNVPPPLILMVSLEGVGGARYAVQNDVFRDNPVLSLDRMLLPECVLESYGDVASHHSAIRPAFDALWNAIGYSGSRHFNEEGVWIGDGR